MRRPTLALLALALAATGCVRASDIDIRHPLMVRAVDPNRIVKSHDFATRQRGLPPGVLNDEASIMSFDPAQICFDATIRELAPVDLLPGTAQLSTPGYEGVPAAQVWADPPDATPYNGLVPIRTVVGYGMVCTVRAFDGRCLVFARQPLYGTRYVPGRVNVYRSRARMCFANNGAVTPASEQVTLELRGGKKAVFRWGLVGAQKK